MIGFKKFCEVWLAIISLAVFIGLINNRNVWAVICTYWCLLVLKNINDVIMSNRKGKDKREGNQT